MTELNSQATVGSWVAQYPQTSRVFESLQIDYCCGGGKPLAEACTERQLETEAVIAQLEQAIEARGDEPPMENWLVAPLADLCDHIEQTHHAFLKRELPRLTAMIGKVAEVHGAGHPEMVEVREVFGELCAELEPHMFKEERILFPSIRQLDQSSAAPAFPFGSIANPIRMMEHEHDNSGGALARMRQLTGDYAVPPEACNTYRATLDGLQELERDLHYHIHKENNILFPRAIEKESTLVG